MVAYELWQQYFELLVVYEDVIDEVLHDETSKPYLRRVLSATFQKRD